MEQFLLLFSNLLLQLLKLAVFSLSSNCTFFSPPPTQLHLSSIATHFPPAHFYEVRIGVATPWAFAPIVVVDVMVVDAVAVVAVVDDVIAHVAILLKVVIN